MILGVFGYDLLVDFIYNVPYKITFDVPYLLFYTLKSNVHIKAPSLLSFRFRVPIIYGRTDPPFLQNERAQIGQRGTIWRGTLLSLFFYSI